MNVLKEINKITTFCTTIRSSYRALSNGSVDKITNVFLAPGQHSIKTLNQIDKGNAKQLTKIKLVHKHGSGYYSLMPFLYKSYAKLVQAIEQHMNAIGGQRVMLPSLYPIEILKKSERFDLLKNELFTLTDRNKKELYLAPTHEEPVTSIISSCHLRHKQLPLLIYQIDSKFRSELRPRFGLLRANQFIMKDLYSFDKDQKSAFCTYDRICESYVDLFNYLNLDFVKVVASNGLMGGEFSHEFHLISKYGEDHIYLCDDCKTAYSKETLFDNREDESTADQFKCPECSNELQHRTSIEIGHTFYLGKKYSEKMDAVYLRAFSDDNTEIDSDSEQSNRIPLEMCCFGIGVTRILTALISQQTNRMDINWPLRIAPYHILIIPPKKGSKENIDGIGDSMTDNISSALRSQGFDVLIDDRSELTIGRRLIDSLAYGFPYKIIIGKKSINEVPQFELHDKDGQTTLTHFELLNRFDVLSKIL